MKVQLKKELLTSTAAIVALSGGVMTMSATSAGAQERDVIVVTAKAREQNLQDVPLAISVFSDEDLEARSISDVQDLADFTPNLEINSSTGRREATLSVRGLGSSTTDEKYQSVGFFVDGIWMGGQVVGLSTADVERIEVIKGPHSTFGRATYGASIDYVTKTPSLDEFSGSVRAQISNHRVALDPNYEVTGNISGPIIPGKVSGSLFVQQRFDSGTAPAVNTPLDIPVGEEETFLISGVLYTEFSENTSLKIRGLYSEDNDTMINGYDSGPQFWVQQGVDILQTASGQAWINGAVPDAVREFYYSADLRPERPHLAGQAPGTFTREKFFVSAIFDHEFDNGYSVNYKGSYLDQTEDALFDGLAAPGRLGGVDVTLGDVMGLPLGFGGGFENVIGEEWQEMTHTIRLLSPGDNRLLWSVGAHYYDSDNTNSTPNVFFIDNFAPSTNTTGLQRVEEISQWAVFGDVSYQITDQLRLSAEGRYQQETVGRQAVPDALFSSSRLGTDISRHEPNFDPRITLSFEPNENHHFYALFAEGHKSGRYNLTSSGPFLLDGTRDPSSFVYVEPEGLRNYEIGWKSTLLDGALISNIAAFYQDVTDQQFVSTIEGDGPSGFVTQLSNVGESEIYGIEADFTYAATDNLVLQSAVGYNDQEFKSDVPPQSGENNYLFNLAGDPGGAETLRGRSFTNVSKVSANGSATYTVPISLGLFEEWSMRADVLFRGRKSIDTANLAYIPANTRVNLRTSLSGENWTLALFVNNLFDDKTAYRANAFPCGVEAITDPASASALGLPAPSLQPSGATFTPLPAGQRCLSLLPSSSRELGASIQVRF